jgi:hypothetical protein
VTIVGSNLGYASSVLFGTVPATIVSDTPGQIVATSPAGTGVVDVTVTTAGGVSTKVSADQFTYVAAPTIASISPSKGPTAGGTSVTITGTNLTNATSVKFGTIAAASITSDTATTIVAVAPAGAAGMADVTVTTTGGTSAISSADQFTYVAAPTVTAISPAAGPLAGTSVTITGTNLAGATAVMFGTTAAASITSDTATTIVAVAPAGVGPVDVTVTTAGGTSATVSADQFTYVAAPTVVSIGPTMGPAAGGTSVTITGTNLAGATSVKFGTVAAASITSDTATTIVAVAPAGAAGAADVTVTTAGGTSATLAADLFTFVPAPTVTSISPTKGSAAGGTSVTITGTNLAGATSVKFGTVAATSITSDTATTIVVVAPAGTAGAADVTVVTAGGASATSTADQFTYLPVPAINLADAGGTYNGSPFTATAQLVGTNGTPVATLDGVGATLTYYSGSTATGTPLVAVPTTAGSYCVVASFPGSANYASAQSSPVTFTIAKATPTLTVADSGGYYDGLSWPANGFAAGVVSGTDTTPASALNGAAVKLTYYAASTATGTPLTGAPTVVGTYTVVASFPGSTNYAAAQSAAVNFVIATAPAASSTQVVDDSQPVNAAGQGCWHSTRWSTVTQGVGGESLLSTDTPGNKQSQAAWYFSSVTPGLYDVAVTWTLQPGLSSKAEFDLYDGSNFIGEFAVNQAQDYSLGSIIPSAIGYTEQGVTWRRLGTVKITSTTFHVSIQDSASDGAIAADAVELRPAGIVCADDRSLTGKIYSSGTSPAATFTTSGAWSTNTDVGFYPNDSVTSASAGRGTGSSQATWTFPVTPGIYNVAANWGAASTMSAGVAYTVYDGATKLGSFTVDQQMAPNGCVDAGMPWQMLGTYTITGNQLIVKVSNTSADGDVNADGVRIQPVLPTIVDNASTTAFSAASNQWTKVTSGYGGSALVSSSTASLKSSWAGWWFTNLQPGTYDVAVTWPASSTLSTAVGFDVYDGKTFKGQVGVNETVAPSDFTEGGVGWKRLGTFTVTGNSFHVSTWNSSAGQICVDAIRLIPSSGSMALMASGTPSAASAALLQTSQLQPIIAAAERDWAAAGVSQTLTDRLKNVQVVVADLPTGYLGLTEGNEILISPNAAGFGWFVDPTPAANEEFIPTTQAKSLKAVDPRAVDRIDLLTVVEHEMGHVLGLDDLDSSLDALMSDRLGVGIRRLA